MLYFHFVDGIKWNWHIQDGLDGIPKTADRLELIWIDGKELEFVDDLMGVTREDVGEKNPWMFTGNAEHMGEIIQVLRKHFENPMDFGLISAREAQKISHTNRVLVALKETNRLVRSAVNDGFTATELLVCECVCQEVRDILVGKGYSVSTEKQEHRQVSLWVSWGE